MVVLGFLSDIASLSSIAQVLTSRYLVFAVFWVFGGGCLIIMGICNLVMVVDWWWWLWCVWWWWTNGFMENISFGFFGFGYVAVCL